MAPDDPTMVTCNQTHWVIVACKGLVAVSLPRELGVLLLLQWGLGGPLPISARLQQPWLLPPSPAPGRQHEELTGTGECWVILRDQMRVTIHPVTSPSSGVGGEIKSRKYPSWRA